MSLRNLTEQAQQLIGTALGAGGLAVDATAGNGNDTAFLAGGVGPGGRVFAMDCQESALAETSKRLALAGLRDRVELCLGRHQDWSVLIPADWKGRVQAVMFNLGYLPGGDKELTTQPASTCAALQSATEWLAPGGMISVVAYRGHAGGREEALAVREWSRTLPSSRWDVMHMSVTNAADTSPELVLIHRHEAG